MLPVLLYKLPDVAFLHKILNVVLCNRPAKNMLITIQEQFNRFSPSYELSADLALSQYVLQWFKIYLQEAN